MGNPTATNTERAEHAQPPPSREGASFTASAGAEQARLLALGGDAPERRGPFLIFSSLVAVGHAPPNALHGVWRWRARTTVDELLTAAGTVLRGADPASGDAVTAGDVAAGAGRGVAGVLSWPPS